MLIVWSRWPHTRPPPASGPRSHPEHLRNHCLPESSQDPLGWDSLPDTAGTPALLPHPAAPAPCTDLPRTGFLRHHGPGLHLRSAANPASSLFVSFAIFSDTNRMNHEIPDRRRRFSFSPLRSLRIALNSTPVGSAGLPSGFFKTKQSIHNFRVTSTSKREANQTQGFLIHNEFCVTQVIHKAC